MAPSPEKTKSFQLVVLKKLKWLENKSDNLQTLISAIERLTQEEGPLSAIIDAIRRYFMHGDLATAEKNSVYDIIVQNINHDALAIKPHPSHLDAKLVNTLIEHLQQDDAFIPPPEGPINNIGQYNVASIFSRLPTGHRTFGQVARVSASFKQCQAMTTENYQQLLQDEFGISENQYTSIRLLDEKGQRVGAPVDAFYKQLRYLRKKLFVTSDGLDFASVNMKAYNIFEAIHLRCTYDIDILTLVALSVAENADSTKTIPNLTLDSGERTQILIVLALLMGNMIVADALLQILATQEDTSTQTISTADFLSKICLATAAYTGDIRVLNHFLHAPYNLTPNRDTLFAAAFSGNVEILRMLLHPSYQLRTTRYTLEFAALSGVQEAIELVRQRTDSLTFPNSSISFAEAAKSGNVDTVRWLSETLGVRIGKLGLDFAANAGKLAVMRYLIEEQHVTPDLKTLTSAASSGSVSAMRYLLETPHNLVPDKMTFGCAALSGNIHAVRFLMEEYHLTPDERVFIAAIGSSNQHMCRFIRQKLDNPNPILDDVAIEFANKVGNPYITQIIEEMKEAAQQNQYLAHCP